jgi:DNA-binding XRE family transcriptional regulator
MKESKQRRWVLRRLALKLRRKRKLQGKSLRTKLKSAREQAWLTQAAAGEIIGQDQTFISKLESGVRDVTFVEVEQMAAMYQQPLSFFRTIEDIEEKEPNLELSAARRILRIYPIYSFGP